MLASPAHRIVSLGSRNYILCVCRRGEKVDGTAYFAYSTSLVQRIASILGEADDAAPYGAMVDKIKEAFSREFITENGRDDDLGALGRH
jgi:hypothetical protein